MDIFKRCMRLTAILTSLALCLTLAFGCSAQQVTEAEVVANTDAPVIEATEPAPTPTPTPVPAVFSFEEDAQNPMPTLEDRLTPGSGHSIGGTVTSNYPLTSVRISITCARSEDEFYPYEESVAFDPAEEIYTYDLTDKNTKEQMSLDAFVEFGTLGIGKHTMTVAAASTGQPTPQILYKTQFYVLSETWEQLDSGFFTGSYKNTLKFFGGDKEKFLFPFQRVWDRYLIAQPEWEEKYITKIDGVNGEKWTVHVDAAPHMQEAIEYMRKASVRVSGTNGDTGVLPLTAFVLAYNGCYVPRFISGTQKISLHSFGTAVDINAALTCNANTKENKALIYDEVKNYLTYNGIKETDAGEKYYDYTYSGAYQNTLIGIPETVINYFLYELAFYRAGFQWGHYYNTKSDAMHFTLTDTIGVSKHNAKTGLKKVSEYYN